MLRMLSTVILASLVAFPLASAADEPPSSLEPARHGSLTLSHEATRVIACTAKREANKLVCAPETASMDSSTNITLRPVAGGQVGAKDKRQPVQVALPQDGTQVKKLDLPVGVWELEWPARANHDRFFMAESDDFAIQLRTEVGSCRKVNDDCVLKADKTQLDVKIPKRCKR